MSVIGGRWRLIEGLGPTVRGQLHRAEGVEDGQVAKLELWEACHVASPGRLAQVEREARIVSRLRHARCLSLLDFGVHDGRPFLVWEDEAGKRLAEELGTPELTVTRSAAIALQVVEGVRHLHAHGVIHREVVADNVLLVSTIAGESVKLGPPRVGATGAGKTDHRGDLYAAGLLLQEMCARRAPPSGVLDRLIRRATAPSSASRFQSADEMLAAFQGLVGEPARPKPSPITPRMRRAVIAGGMVVGGLSLVSLAVIGLRSTPAPAPVPAPKVAEIAPALPPPPPPPRLAPPPVPVVAPVPAPPPPTPAVSPPQSEEIEIWALLEKGNLDAVAARIGRLVARNPEAAWPRFARGEFYFQRFWRRDCVEDWELALTREPPLRHDPRFTARLCLMLDDKWEGGGVQRLLDLLGAEAAPILRQCVASAKTPRLRDLASRALARVGG